MNQIVEQLIELNHRDWLDYIGLLLPAFISAVLIVQNGVINKRNLELQKQIHNRDIVNQAHEDILRIYRSYYDFIDAVYTSQLVERVKHADVNFAFSYTNHLFSIKRHIIQSRDLARLLLSNSDPEMYQIVEECLNNEIAIIDKYYEYISNGRLCEVSENAWNTVLSNANNGLFSTKYNYQELYRNQNQYRNFLALCKSLECEEIDKMLERDIELHTYENYDALFEKYLKLESI